MRFVVSDRGLEPWDDAARDFIKLQNEGEALDVELCHPRDAKEFRRIMLHIRELAKALHIPPEKLRAELLIKTGNFALLDFLHDGKPVIAVSSMSKYHMRDNELHTFWHEAREVIRTDYLPHVQDAAERDYLADQLSLESV